MSEQKGRSGAVQTTGHAWDGDIQEYNNPLPRWWLWAFYVSVAFALIYWVLYPAWPVAGSYTKGLMNQVSYESGGEEVTSHWNTRALLAHDLQSGEEALKQQAYLERVSQAGYDEILADPEMMAFTRAIAKGLFGDNCAPCHGTGGAGVVGLFPNLADDDWLWGGTVESIEQTLVQGRVGFMPSFRGSFSDQQLDDLASHVLSLSGHEVDTDAAQRGARLFQGEGAGCYYCHGESGTGLASQGAANLTDSIWTLVNVPEAEDLKARKALVRQVILNGAERHMPAWSERLKDSEIKLLTVYVHELGGGQ